MKTSNIDQYSSARAQEWKAVRIMLILVASPAGTKKKGVLRRLFNQLPWQSLFRPATQA